jgi:poly(3-hydroxybutyrate) depolymerase
MEREARMRTLLARMGLLVTALLAGVTASAGIMAPGKGGSFTFTGQGAFSETPITVYYYRAASAGPDAKVVFSMHGVGRNTKGARDNWTDAAEKHGLVVLAPEFDDKRFPRRLYQLGGMEQPDRSKWTFNLIEEIFDRVRSEEALATPSYILFGHSAGAQFAHRFALVMDKARVSTVVTANAGSYTMPEYAGAPGTFPFPWALEESRVPPDALKGVLARKVIVLLGEKDTDTNDPDLARSREAMAQGAYRLERGQKFFATGKAQAQKMGTPFNWQIITVPGIGHEARPMSRAAATALFGTKIP